MWPSSGPLLHGVITAAFTAPKSRFSVCTKRTSEWMPVFRARFIQGCRLVGLPRHRSVRKASTNAASFGQLLEPDPLVEAPPAQAQAPGHLSHFEARSSQLLDRLKQPELLLSALPGRFHLVAASWWTELGRPEMVSAVYSICQKSFPK